MGDTEDGRQGLTEDQLIDDATMDTLIRESVSQTVGDNAFSQARVHQWTSSMTDGCLKRLAALNKPFKYVCHFTLGQRVRLLQHALLPGSCNDSILHLHIHAHSGLHRLARACKQRAPFGGTTRQTARCLSSGSRKR